MYTLAAQRQIELLSVSEDFKAQLSGEAGMSAYALYLKLPEYLAPLFAGIDAPQLEELAVNCYLYFRFVIALDQLLAQPGGPTKAQLLDCIALHEQAVRGLACLFSPKDSFWQYFQRCQQRFAAANVEQPLGAEQPRLLINQEEFEERAAGRSAICFALVHALASLGQPRGPVQPLLDCLAGLHVGSQYFDDIDSFVQDWDNGQHSYAHARVSEYLAAQSVPETSIGLHARQRCLFASGIAQQHMQLGLEHYSKSLSLASELGLDKLADYLRPQHTRYTQQCDWAGGLESTARRQLPPLPVVIGD